LKWRGGPDRDPRRRADADGADIVRTGGPHRKRRDRWPRRDL